MLVWLLYENEIFHNVTLEITKNEENCLIIGLKIVSCMLSLKFFDFFYMGKQVFLVININDYEDNFQVIADSLS